MPLCFTYLIFKNLDPSTFFYSKLKQLEIQLAYKLGGFTDKENLKLDPDAFEDLAEKIIL